MNWSDISGMVGKYAPMVGTLLGGAPGAAIGSLIASTLGVENTPQAVKEALENDPNAGEAIRQLQEKNRHQYEMMVLELQRINITEQAKTARAELKSNDRYISRWRPTFGYVLALSFFIWTSAFSYLLIKIINNPEGMAATVTAVSQLMGSLSLIWSLALGVLGINISKRSKDKEVELTGKSSQGLLQKLFKSKE